MGELKGINKIMISVLAIFGMVFLATMAHADPINVGDVIYLYDGPGNTGGGEFKVYKGGTYLFDTFCLERNEYFNFGQPLTVSGISNSAILGGVGPAGDPLDPRTAYLYTQFRAGTLSGYDYNIPTARVNDANSLQLAIWYIENEIPSLNDLQAKTWVEEATRAGWTNIGNVRVLNLRNALGGLAQDQLVMVPEPSTLLLLGAGLIGVGLVARRRRKQS